MQDKLINFNKCVEIIKPPYSVWSFGTVSPIDLISGPTTTLFYCWAGSVSYTFDTDSALGTIVRMRYAYKGVFPLKRDQWEFRMTGTPSLIRIHEVENRYIPYH
ncbi:MAG TPA: hypothetical protein VJB63_04450 [Patescibacteria group bacterium]|nr:hypothetical protein [Patescibacteria group bacterium]